MMRWLAILLLLATTAQAQAPRPAGSLVYPSLSMPDDVAFSGGVVGQAMQKTVASAAVEVSCAITSSTGIIMAFGQSLVIDQGSKEYVPKSSAVHQLNPYDGKCYTAREPLVGNWTIGPSNWMTRVADQLIANGTRSRMILLPRAIGSSSVLDWSNAGTLNHRVAVECLRAKQLGWVGNSSVRVAVLWVQGEAEVALGTTQAQYESRYRTVQATMTGMGCDFPWFIAKSSYPSNYAPVQAAQAALPDGVRTFVGANSDSLTGSNRGADGVHWSDLGLDNNAALWTPILTPHFN